MLAYLSYMTERLLECRRMLRRTGSIYLHCDPTASHYLKIVMDAIFGPARFRRECIWDIAVLSGFKTQARNWIRGHDTVLYYTASSDFTFNRLRQPHRREYLARFNKMDEHGRRYFDGRGKPRYLDDVVKKGKAVGDVWSDIMSFQQMPTAKEKMGYPTQKPESLLERIIKASSKEGDLVLDPFCGCATTVVAAQKLNRRWAGIEISPFAVETVMRRRLKRANVEPNVEGIPTDLAGATRLAKEYPFRFETWAVSQVPGLVPNTVQVGDGGVDGRGHMLNEDEDGHTLVVSQVKAGSVTVDSVRAFSTTLRNQKAAAGVFITMQEGAVTHGMRKEATKLGTFRPKGSVQLYDRFQFWSMEKWLRHGKARGDLPSLPVMADPYTGKELGGATLFRT